MPSSPITVETVTHRTQMRRFRDVPFLLYGDDPRWSPGVRAHEDWRLDERRHPFFDRGHAAYFLARVAGRPAGRVTAHIARPGDTAAWFGFLDAPDDRAVVAALIDAAADWLGEEGATSMTGPVSWTPDEEFGTVVAGGDVPGVTGRPWHPAHLADHLVAAGLEPGETRHTYRLACRPVDDAPIPAVDGDAPAVAGRFADPRLVLDRVAGVPDVTAALAGADLRSAWRIARRASAHAFTAAVCVRCDGDPEIEVPRLMAAAAGAGYAEIVVPWAPPGTEPETSHRVFTRRWS